MLKRCINIFLLGILMTVPALALAEQQNPLEESEQYSGHAYFFHSESCPHCKEEMEFLIELSKQPEYLDVQFLEFEITQIPENRALLQEIGRVLDLDVGSVPMTFIGNDVIVGFGSEETTGVQIQRAIDQIIEEGDADLIGLIIAGEAIDASAIMKGNNEQEDGAMPESVHVPLIGEVKTANLSLPILSIFLGFVDGFNPCAMWILVFLISLMLGMKDRKRMWILGTTFIIASGAIYYVFMAAWLNVLMFIGFLFAVRLIIGLVAIGGGAYSIHDFYTNKDATCKVGDLEEKQKTMQKMRDVVKRPSFLAAFFGMIALALAVNLVELICSAGIPAVFTQILNMSDISIFVRYAYMMLYILFYMIDDIAVFVVAMVTLEITGATAKYTRATRLIGGIIMVLIGILMILKPELLTFA